MSLNLPSPEPLIPSAPEAIDFAVFSSYERKGVIVMAAAGVLSCTLVSSLLLYIIFSALSPWPKSSPSSNAHSPFLRKQVAVFVICLLSSDLIQSIAGVTQVKWAAENRIYAGRACTVQAAALVMGDLSSTVWSCVIALHTFYCLALAKQWPRWAVWATVFTGWAIPLILTVIGPTTLATEDKGPFFGIAGTWCFIASKYAIPRLGIHYVPMFVGSVVIIVFYGLVFLVLRGTLKLKRLGASVSPITVDNTFARERIVIAKRMLWYPVAYLTCALPIAIMRLVGLSSEIVPDSVWIFGMFFLFLLGSVDTIIYATTRTMIIPIRLPKSRKMRAFSGISSEDVITPKGDRVDIDGYKYMNYHPYPYPYPGRASLRLDESDGMPDEEKSPGVIHVTLERIQEDR